LLVWLSNDPMPGEYHKPVYQSWTISFPVATESAEIDRRFYRFYQDNEPR